MLTVVGGKITTYRRLAEAAVERLRPFFPKLPPPWTAMAPLPGGDIAALGFASFTAFRADLVRRRPGFEPALLSALARRHGTRTDTLLADARDAGDLGPVVAGVSQREVEYMLRTEWARTPEDILWRRTKAGLLVTEKDRAAAADVLSKWLSSAAPAR
jgi:glycerol-3-phosphate dehydrogenase